MEIFDSMSLSNKSDKILFLTGKQDDILNNFQT